MNRIFTRNIEAVKGRCRSLLLAVSGGIDSMCMAELFARSTDGPDFAVAHCNFHLRGEESDGDEALVRRWADEHGVTVHVNDFDTEGYAHEHGISIEMAARDLRYSWFAELCREYGYDAVAVAHNANDNAETLMLNLLRGAGMNGLCGMALFSAMPVRASDFPEREMPCLVRPLLNFTRKQIEGYMFAEKLQYREDSTNASPEYKRNRLRNEVFPIFEIVNPSFIRTLNREMGHFSEAGEIVSDYCKTIADNLVSGREDGGAEISIEALKAQKHWRYLLYFILEPYGFNSSSLASIEDLLSSDRTVSGKTFASSEFGLYMEREMMVIRPLPEKGTAVSGNTDIMPVRAAGTYRFNGRSVSVELVSWSDDMPVRQPEGVLIFDAEKLRFPFVLRAWSSGDWLVPLGMRGKKKVSDLFADLKFSSMQKQSAVMIVDTRTPGLAESRHLAGIAGLRMDSRYKVTAATTSVIRITYLQ